MNSEEFLEIFMEIMEIYDCLEIKMPRTCSRQLHLSNVSVATSLDYDRITIFRL